jgi:energy-coupling factor transporter ATP-binding protein EcfA2
MYYGIQTVEFERSNLLTGITGSGKSSLIDALQIVILGEETSRFFNRSATGSKSDRSLVTYLRGKYHDNEYKRADRAFSSYLAVDFYDEVRREEFCYGVVFDLAEDNAHEKNFFYISSAFELEWALKSAGSKSAARNRHEFTKELQKRGVAHKLFAPREYKDDLLVRLGIYDEHFFQVFRTAIAYVPLDKIEDFIVKNICHIEDTINVQNMKAAIQEYQRMQRDMADFQERQQELEALKAVSDDFDARLETYEAQQYIVKRAQADQLREEQIAAENETLRLEDELEQHNLQDAQLETLAAEKQARQSELVRLLADDPNNKRRTELESKVKLCNENRGAREKRRDELLLLLEQRVLAWKRHLDGISGDFAPEHFERAEISELSRSLGLYGQYNKDTFSSLDPLGLSETNIRLERFRNSALAVQTEWKSRRNEANRQAEEYRARLAELKKGVKSYPKDLLALRAFLRNGLPAQNGWQAEVSILADLITITEPEWVNVTEGYMRRQRLYLLTAPEHYRQAVSLLKRFSKENRCYQYRVVNTGGVLNERMDAHPNSLAGVIETEHPAARKYIDYLLGRVERVDDISAVDGRRTALTADGMLYQGFTTSRMNEADWQMRYIGQDSIAAQIAETTRLLDAENARIQALSEMIAPLQPLVDEKTLSDEFLDNLRGAVAGALELPALEQELRALWDELGRIDDSYSKKLEAEQQSVTRELASLRGKSKQLSEKIGELKTLHETYFKLSDEKEQAWEVERAVFAEMYPDGSEVAERTYRRYESELLQKGSAEKLRLDFEPALMLSVSRLDALKLDFRRKAEEHNRRHTDSAISTELSGDEWRAAYAEIKNVRLDEYTEHVTAARTRAEEIFRNEFINQIKRNIDTVKREIGLLNRALEEYTFGQTKYRFKCSPTENAEMRKYYDMITNSRLDGASIYDLVEPGMELAEYEPLVKTLFQMISSEGVDLADRQQIEANIEKFKSFQTYLRFDLVEVIDGTEYPLSRTMGSKSGGERQTPFYVAILASLMKTYRVNQDANSLRLVVFDEAFDKIDTSRIEECVNMLREIGFQSIIAAPDNKAPYIAHLVERTLVVIKTDDKTSVLRPHRKTLEV